MLVVNNAVLPEKRDELLLEGYAAVIRGWRSSVTKITWGRRFVKVCAVFFRPSGACGQFYSDISPTACAMGYHLPPATRAVIESIEVVLG
jgi:hypothetical protein